jgi:hypothetical protein
MSGNESLALVSSDPGAGYAGIELIFQEGRRLRINQGID